MCAKLQARMTVSFRKALFLEPLPEALPLNHCDNLP